ncbi:hypothetical protein [Marinomonas sp.]|uniref:hypothetical protein n=1 Tax=Marinomonas sp. TaxID=1904862 RepID=UPI003BA8D90C
MELLTISNGLGYQRLGDLIFGLIKVLKELWNAIIFISPQLSADLLLGSGSFT